MIMTKTKRLLKANGWEFLDDNILSLDGGGLYQGFEVRQIDFEGEVYAEILIGDQVWDKPGAIDDAKAMVDILCEVDAHAG